MIGRVRIVVEHARAGVKRGRLVTDPFCGWRKGLADEAKLVARGVPNPRASGRTA